MTDNANTTLQNALTLLGLPQNPTYHDLAICVRTYAAIFSSLPDVEDNTDWKRKIKAAFKTVARNNQTLSPSQNEPDNSASQQHPPPIERDDLTIIWGAGGEETGGPDLDGDGLEDLMLLFTARSPRHQQQRSPLLQDGGNPVNLREFSELLHFFAAGRETDPILDGRPNAIVQRTMIEMVQAAKERHCKIAMNAQRTIPDYATDAIPAEDMAILESFEACSDLERGVYARDAIIRKRTSEIYRAQGIMNDIEAKDEYLEKYTHRVGVLRDYWGIDLTPEQTAYYEAAAQFLFIFDDGFYRQFGGQASREKWLLGYLADGVNKRTNPNSEFFIRASNSIELLVTFRNKAVQGLCTLIERRRKFPDFTQKAMSGAMTSLMASEFRF